MNRFVMPCSFLAVAFVPMAGCVPAMRPNVEVLARRDGPPAIEPRSGRDPQAPAGSTPGANPD